MIFNASGTTLYVLGQTGQDINAYTLSDSFATGTYSLPVTGLEPATTYYVRSFAENSTGLGYSSATESFTTSRLITVAGTLYKNDGVTPMGAGKTIVAAVGTSTVSLHSTTTDASGNYSIDRIPTAALGTWATTTRPFFGITDAVYGNGLFVAVGAVFANLVMTSPDGLNWTYRSALGDDDDWRSITYGNGRFVAVGECNNGQDCTMYSDDGINWTAGVVPAEASNDYWSDLAYGNGRFVATACGLDTFCDTATSGPRFMYSDDGANWTLVSGFDTTDAWGGVTYGNGRFVTVSDGGDFAYSDDGSSWATTTAPGGTANYYQVMYGSGLFVGVSYTNGRIATSTDGITWNSGVPVSASHSYAAPIYVNGQFIITNSSGDALVTTRDGITWESISMLGDDDIWAVSVYGQGRLLLFDTSFGTDPLAYADAGFGADTPITLFVDETAMAASSSVSSSTATTLTYGLNQNAGTTTLQADLIADKVLLTKSQISSSSNEIWLSDADVYDNDDDTDILFTATTSTTTFNADLRIASGTTVYASQHLVIDGDWDNYGTFEAERGEVVANSRSADITSARLVGSVDSEDFTPRAVTLSSDGTKMYVGGDAADEINEFTLSVPWDITTATFVQASSTAVPGGDEGPEGLAINTDGTTLFVAGRNDEVIIQYDLSTPWDISTMAYVASTSVVAHEIQLSGLAVKPDGTKLYITGSGDDDVTQFDLSTSWDITSASYVGQYDTDVEGNEDPTGVTFTADGTRMLVVNNQYEKVNLFTLATPWDITSATFTGDSFSVLFPDSDYSSDVFVDPTGTTVFLVDDGSTNSIYQFNLDDNQRFTGNFSATSSLYDLTQSGNGGLTFGGTTTVNRTYTITLDSVQSGATTTVFNAGSTYTFQNIDWQGGDASSTVNLRSSVSGTVWYLDVDGTKDVDFIFVADSDATLSASTIIATSSTDGGNNTNWSFVGGVTIESGGITITGTLYMYDGVTPMGAGYDVVAAVGTSTVSLHSTTTDASGNYSIEGIATSSIADGTWATSTVGFGSGDITTDIEFGNGVFVGVQEFGGELVYSYDGINWLEGTYPTSPNAKSVAYGNGVFVVVGGSGTERILVSTDGINWELTSAVGNNDAWNDVSFGNGRFVAVAGGGDDRAMYSDDGYNWTAVSAAGGNNDDWYSLTYGNGRFVATSFGSSDTVMYSADGGESWTLGALAWRNWQSIEFGGGVFMAFPQDLGSGNFATSTDGATWTYGNNAPLENASYGIADNIVYANGTFFVGNDCSALTVNDCLMYTSDFGVTWATTTVDTTFSRPILGYGNGRLIMIDGNSSEDIVNYIDAGFGEDTPITLFVDENATTSSSTATTLTYGLNHNAGSTTLQADLIADTVLLNKSQISSSSNAIYLDDRGFYDYENDTDILFTATTSTTTVNADLRIASGTTVFAPQHLIVDGDFDNYGTFEAERGEVIANSKSADVLSARFLQSVSTPGALFGVDISSNGLHFYIADDGGNEIEQYSMSIPGDVSTASFVRSTTTSAQEAGVRDTAISTAGDKLYLLGSVGDSVYQYDLSVNFDISTASYTHATSVTDTTLVPQGLSFSNDGVKMYVAFDDSLGVQDSVHEFTLGTAWDVSTAAFVASASVYAFETTIRDVEISPDGTQLFITGTSQDDITVFELNTPWSVASLSRVGEISVASQDTSPVGMALSANGDTMYMAGFSGARVYQYQLDDNQLFTGNFSATSSLFDFTIGNTATVSPAAITEIDNNYHVGGSAAGPYAGLVELTGTSTLSGTGNFGFVEVQGSASSTEVEATFTDLVIASGGDFTAPQYGTLNISGDFDPSAGSFNTNGATTYFGGQGTYNLELGFVASLDVTAQDGNQNGLAFSPDGTKMYMHGYGSATPSIFEYTLSTPWDIATAQFIQSSSTAAEDTYGQGMSFSPDGGHLFTTGYNSTNINLYVLNTPWDISTLEFVASTSISAQTGIPNDVASNDDGTRLYVLSENRNVYEYSLVPYDLSTIQYEGFADIPYGAFPTAHGFDFSADGQQLFVVTNNGLISDFAMTASWDISTLSLTEEYDVTAVSVAGEASNVQLSSDGTNLYFSGDANLIHQYAVGSRVATTTGANALGSVVFNSSGTTAFTGNTSTSDFVIRANATVTAPALLTVGDFENYGNFDSNNGTIYSTGVGNFDLNQAYLVATTSLNFDGVSRGGFVSPDEAHIYGVSFSDEIVWYELTTPGDLSTASSSGTYSISDAAELFISNDGARLYVGLGNNNDINQYALGTAWDVRTATFVASTTLSELTDTEYRVFINPAGTDMFVNSSDSSGTLAHYTLSTAWDVTSASFVASETGQFFTDIRDFVFNTAGTRLFTSNSFGAVKEYILSAPWTIASMTEAENTPGRHVLLQQLQTGNTVDGMAFNATQDTLYVIADGAPNVQQYSIPATFRGALTGTDTLTDLTTTAGYTILLDQASTTNITVNSGSELQTPTSSLSVAGSLAVNGKLETTNQGGIINFTGTTQTISGNLIGSSTLPQVNVTGTYTLSDTASTSALTINSGGSLIAPNATLSIAGDYTNNGTFTAGSGEVVIDTPSPHLSNLTSVGSLDVSAYDGGVSGAAFSADGTTLYFVGADNSRFFWTTLSTPFDATTAGSVSSSSLTSVLQAAPAELVISPDGTNVYMVDTIYDAPNGFSHDIMQFSMNPAWDASSLSFVASTTDSFGQIDGLTFSADGSKLYYTVESQSVLRTYTLGTPWDITSLTGDRLRTANAHTLFTFGHTFSPAGDRLFSLGFFGEIAESTLDVPFDTFSLDRTSTTIDPGTGSDHRSINFSPDGKYILVAHAGSDEIDQYQVATDPIVSGTMTGASAFNNLTQNTNLPLTFGAAASTTGTFAIEPSNIATGATTTIFNAGSTYTFENIDWAGASSTNELVLRSSASGTPWYLDVSGSQLNVEYVNVQDSDATLTSGGIIAAVSTDSGNNTNWLFTEPAQEWNDTDWTLYDTITIRHENIDEPLGDFPVYVNLADLSPAFWATIVDGGGDIRVTTNAGTPVELAREVVSASTTLQTGELHFKAPYISEVIDTSFRIYYNGVDSDYTANATYGAQNVWSNGYVAVYHMNEDPSTGAGAVIDSTMYANHGTSTGSMLTEDLVDSQLGSGYALDGINDYIIIPGTTDFDFSASDYSINMWVNLADISTQGAWTGIVSKGNGSGNDFAYQRNAGSNDARLYHGAGGQTVDINRYSDLASDSWRAVTLSYDQTDAAVYYDGLQIDSIAVGSPSYNASYPVNLGASRGAGIMEGIIDEYRFASTSRSSAWIFAEYVNQSVTTDFYTITGATGATGSSTISDHDAGQVNNAFDFQNKTNEPLYAFKLTPDSGTATVTRTELRITGWNQTDLNPSDFTNLRLYRDLDNDAAYDASDTLLSNTGTISFLNQNTQIGTLVFTEDYLATTTQNYLVVADWNVPDRGAHMNLELVPGGIDMIDSNGPVTVSGAVDRVQHARNNRGGGGSSAAVGGAAPAGDGDVGGGGAGGGEEGGAIDTNTGGGLIGNSPNFNNPTAGSGAWVNAANAYDQIDGTYATTDAANSADFTGHSHSVPGTNTITGIAVKLEISGTTAAGSIGISLSWDGGTSWTSAQNTPTLTTTDAVVTLGGPSDLWGRTWTASELSNANFAVRLTGAPSSNTIQVDAIQVRVYNQATGGGGGGGGAI